MHFAPSHLFKIHFNILPCTPRSSKWSLSFGFFPSTPLCIFPIRAAYPAHLIVVRLIVLISIEEYNSLLSLTTQLLHLFFLLFPNLLLVTVFSNNRSPCASLSASPEVLTHGKQGHSQFR